jgi:hypothetical protein
MLVTQIVLETVPGKAHAVADLVCQLSGVELRLVEGDNRVLVSRSVPDGQNPEPEALSEVLRAMSEQILQVALIGEEESS